MPTPQEAFELLYGDSRATAAEEAQAFAWFHKVKGKIEQDAEAGDWVILHMRFRDKADTYELMPRYAGEVLIRDIPFHPELREQVESAKLIPYKQDVSR